MQHFQLVLRVGKAFQPALADRVEGYDARSSLRRAAQIAQHAGMIGAGILPYNEDRIGLFKILQQHRALADTHGLRQRDATCLVAHIGAIGKIVRAIGAHEKLVEKGRLIGSAAGRIEFHPVGRVETLQNAADSLKSLIPFNGFIFVRCRVVAHGMGKAPRIFQIVIRPFPKLGNRVFAKKGRRSAPVRCLPGNGLDAVFTKFKRRAMFGITPCTTGTIEPIRLIGFQKRTGASQRCTAGQQLLATAFQRTPSACRAGTFADKTGFFTLAHLFIL